MEASAKIVLKCVGLLGMLVLSLAAAPPSQDSVVTPNQLTKFGVCLGSCGIVCAIFVEEPPVFETCFTACAVNCKPDVPLPPPTSLNAVGYGCTRTCVSSMSKVMASSTAKPSIHDLKSYAKGYVDSCYQACSKNNKLS